MARQRAGAVRPEGRMLNPLERLQFAVGPDPFKEWRFGTDERELKAIYAANREALLTSGNLGPLHVWGFWRFEAAVPELQDESEDELWFVDGGPAAYARLEQRRIRWLLGPGRPLFEDLPGGEGLLARLRARQLAEQVDGSAA